MAAFSTLALLGLAGGAGLFAGKKLAPKPTTAGQPAAPTTTGQATPPVMPTPANQGMSTAVAGAMKKRRQTTAGTSPRYTTPGQSLIAPVDRMRTLLGS